MENRGKNITQRDADSQSNIPANSADVMANVAHEMAELDRKKLSDRAIEHLRAYAKFYIWAIPLFDLGHINIGKRTIEFKDLVSKRFLVGMGNDGNPKIEVQASEMNWMASMPWAYAGIHYKSGRIVLFSRPESPLASSAFIIPVDLVEKILPFQNKRFINITESSFFDMGYAPRRVCLELKEIEDGFFTKKKEKYKL